MNAANDSGPSGISGLRASDKGKCREGPAPGRGELSPFLQGRSPNGLIQAAGMIWAR